MMLYLLHEQYDDEIYTVFCNTGKEHPATLDFVRECGDRWGIDAWLEYDGKKSYKTVDYETASRNGEPFARLIEDKKYLPNMVARFCTSELKVLTIERYLKDIGITDYDMAVGIRGDEPRRLAKMRNKGYILPLSNITERDVHDFWQTQDFDLGLPDAAHNLYSNCDLCFLKGGKIKQSVIREDPQLADWWIEQEVKIGGKFRSDQPDYATMKMIATDQGNLFGDDESIPCFCGD
jgi:3'-phosphoadenosine 5'-phosphosulfate sulfotransferase (PAPS reductase)/FAD synthetase